MVRRDPDGAPRLVVRKRDGRRMAFAPGRLRASLAAALQTVGAAEPTLAADLCDVVVAYLASHPEPAPLSTARLAQLVDQVLTGAGHGAAAAAFARLAEERRSAASGLRIRPSGPEEVVRDVPPAAELGGESWSKGRLIQLLANEARLDDELAQQVASDVERTLFASGLRSVSAALLREWIDNELAVRGLPARLGQRQWVGLPAHELRELLATGSSGREVERATSERLLGRYALREAVPPEVAAAHEDGRLELEHIGRGARVDALVLAPWRLPVLAAAAPARRARLAALGPLARALAHHVARELVLVWDGPALPVSAATELLLDLAEPAPDGCALVLALPADRPATVEAFLGALQALAATPRWGLPRVRLPAAALSHAMLERAVAIEDVDARLQFTAALPRPGLASCSVAVNLARAALDAGPRRVHDFLARLDASLALARTAIASQAALLEDGAGVRSELRRRTGLALPARPRLALVGLAAARRALLGEGPRAASRGADLAAAVGDRVRAALEGLQPAPTIGPADARCRARLGRLDLRAHGAARSDLPLLAERDGFRYDDFIVLAPTDDAERAGRREAEQFRLAGFDDDAPLPRSTGGSARRLAFLRGLLALHPPVADLHPCA